MAPSIWQLLIVLLIIVVIFGTKKLRNMGGDLGSAIRNFKKSVKEGETEGREDDRIEDKPGRVIEGEATTERKDKVG